jgi:starch synthase (maltosyl-transferring)
VRPGSEEYLDSEKYQYRPRDWAAAARDHLGIADFVTQLNQIRRAHPALHRLRNLHFHPVDQPELMCFSKRTGGSSIPPSPAANGSAGDGITGDSYPLPGGDTVLVVVNVDPHQTREATVWIDLAALGAGSEFTVTDELTGESYRWGRANYVRLDPATRPAHIFTVTPGV